MDDWLEPFLEQQVVVDLADHFSVYGKLLLFGPNHLQLETADLHDETRTNSSAEVYAIETKQLGIRANRRRVSIPRRRLVAISLLDDVLE
jgi:hypothetical protein